MKYELSPAILDQLKIIVGEKFHFVDIITRTDYGHDETEDYNFPPDVLLKPRTTLEVSGIMKIALANNIPVTTIGGRTGLSGGALCINGGIGLSMERFNQILEIDENNFQVTVEPGVVTQSMRDTLAERQLFYPPDPSSQGSCFIGGNVAENAGGARAVKYGTTKDYVLNLEVVLADGNIIWTGANTLKNATGYNLTQLVTGSEGTLGIITKIVLRLLPVNKFNILMLVPFFNAEQACEAVAKIFQAGITPSALEFMERAAIDFTLRYVDGSNLNIHDRVEAHLLIEVDGNYMETLYLDAEKITEVLEQFDIDDILFADSDEQKNALWKLRRAVGEAVKSHSVYKEEDTVVPRNALPTLLKGIKHIGDKYGFTSICYGHAGDGNLHVNIIKGELSDEKWHVEIPKGITEIFELTVKLKGTISGEHGIGYVQKNYMHLAFDNVQLNLMKSIKKVFDPTGILNPGKIFPDNMA